jgi:TonB family protein
MYMGTAAIIRKDFGAAIDHLQRAQRLDPTRAGMASMWMAVARQGEENVHEAESLYRTALSLQDPKSPEAVVIGRVYSQFLRAQGRQVEADELDARTRATQKANAPKKPTLSSGIHRVGAGVTPPQLLQKKEPEYSLEARAAKLAGSSVLYAEIGLDGLAHNVQVVERLGLGLDEKAVEAISQWRFKPGAKDGKPVTVAATIEVNFKLL